MNGEVGFNPEVAVNFNKELNNLFDQGRNLHKYYVDNIYELITYSWYAPEAVAMDEYIKSEFIQIEGTLYTLDFHLRSCALMALRNWCEVTQTDMSSIPISNPYGLSNPYRYEPLSKKWINISAPVLTNRQILSKRSDGFIGIISENISVINEHIKIYQNSMIELLDYYNELFKRHHDMLIGYNQMYQYEMSSKDLRYLVTNELYYVASTLTNKMNETKEKYMQTAQANTQMFASGN